MLEKSVERHLVEGVKKLGGLCYKFVSPGSQGVPDRIIVTAQGRIIFAELKTEKGVLSKIQQYVIGQMRLRHADVRVLYSLAQVKELLAEIEREQDSRPDKDSYYLAIAEAVMKRSTCLRRKYGAVIVKNDEIISTGYNGSPREEKNCCDEGHCWRMENNVPHGEDYTHCKSVHAEMNAIISASRVDMQGATLYLACDYPEAEPCDICRRLIKNAGISRVVTRETR